MELNKEDIENIILANKEEIEKLGEEAWTMFVRHMLTMETILRLTENLQSHVDTMYNLKDKLSEIRFNHFVKTNEYINIPTAELELYGKAEIYNDINRETE